VLTVTPPGSRRPGVAAAAGQPLTRELAEGMVKRGDVPAALVLPKGIEGSLMSFGRGAGVKAQIFHDPSDPIASKLVGGLLQPAVLRVSAASGGFVGQAAGGDPEALLPLRYEEIAVLGERRDNPMVAFYAAGIAVMFIMFSAAAAGGA